MDLLEQLRQAYADYFAAMEDNRAETTGLRGTLNVLAYGPGGRDDTSVRFAGRVQALLADAHPDPEERMAIFDFMVQTAWDHRKDSRVAMMLTAVHGYLIPLTAELDSAQAGELLRRYDSLWPRRDRTPVMGDFVKSLRQRSRQ